MGPGQRGEPTEGHTEAVGPGRRYSELRGPPPVGRRVQSDSTGSPSPALSPPETQLTLETAVSTAHTSGSQRGSPTESLPLQEASGTWNHAVQPGAKSAVGRPPSAPESSRRPYSSTCGPSLPPKPSSCPLSWTTQGPPPARPPEVATGQRNLPSAPPASSCAPPRQPPVPQTHPAPPGHSSPGPRPHEAPCSETCTHNPSPPENLTGRGAWRGHRLGHNSSGLAHSAPPAPAPFSTEVVGHQLPLEAFCDLTARGLPEEPGLVSADCCSESLRKEPSLEGCEGRPGPRHRPDSAGSRPDGSGASG